MRLDHVGLTVGDLDAMTSWYVDALKLEVEFEFALDDVDFRGVMLRSSDGFRIELLHRTGNVAGVQAASPIDAALTRGYGHVAFDVPDVDAAYDALVAVGATDRMWPRPSPEPGVRMAYVADPEGNLIELLDRTASTVGCGGFETGASAPSSTTEAGGFETGASAPSSTTEAGGFETGASAPSSTTEAGGFETGASAPSSTTGSPPVVEEGRSPVSKPLVPGDDL